MIDITSIIITLIVTVTPLVVQIELSKRNLKNDFTKKIKNAVSRDARERKKIYNKLCELEKKVDQVLKK